jgi:hypothetical protein
MNIILALNINNFHHLHNKNEIIKTIIGVLTQIQYFNTKNKINFKTQINAGSHGHLKH